MIEAPVRDRNNDIVVDFQGNVRLKKKKDNSYIYDYQMIKKGGKKVEEGIFCAHQGRPLYYQPLQYEMQTLLRGFSRRTPRRANHQPAEVHNRPS